MIIVAEPLEGLKKSKKMRKKAGRKPTKDGKIKILGIPDFPSKARMVGRAIKLGTVGQLGKLRRIGRSSNVKSLPPEEQSKED